MPARRAATPATCRAPPTFPDDEAWHIGTPDLIVEIPKPHIVPAAGGDLWIDYIADSGLTEDRYLQAVEAKPGPGARAVVHHLLTYLIQDIDQDEVLAGRLDDRPTNNESFLNEFAVGKNGDILPEGTAQAGEGRIEDPLQPALSPVGQGNRRPRARRIEVLSQGLQAEVPPDLAADRQRARRARHPAPTPSRVTTATTASRSRRASPRCRRTCTIAASGCASRRSCRSGRAETLNCMYFDFNWHKVYNYADEVDAAAAGGHRAAHHPVARQHRQQSQQSRSAQLDRLRPADDGRDGVLVGDVDLSRRRGLQDDGSPSAPQARTTARER